MAGDDSKPASDGIPAWQRDATSTASAADAPHEQTSEAAAPAQATSPSTAAQPAAKDDIVTEKPLDGTEGLETAQRFLQDEKVKAASPEEKLSFLKSKGITNDLAQKLLAQAPQTSTTESSSSPPQLVTTSDRPPVITYPEFLAKPARPPPLVTQSVLLNTLSATAALSTLLYASSTYLVAPMVEALTSARADLYAHASDRLSTITTTLESCISELPPSSSPSSLPQSRTLNAEEEGSDADPTELFHRDVGTQTSPLEFMASSSTAGGKAAETPSEAQARRIQALAAAIDGITQDFDREADTLQAMHSSLADTHSATQGRLPDSWQSLTYKQGEPDDEIRKAKDNTRRLKGVLLSTRFFAQAR